MGRGFCDEERCDTHGIWSGPAPHEAEMRPHPAGCSRRPPRQPGGLTATTSWERPSPILPSWANSPRSLGSHGRLFPLTWNTRNSQPIGGSPSAHRKRPPRSQTHWDSSAQRKSLSLRCIVCAANRTKRLFGNSSINWRPRTHLNFWLCS